MQSQSKMRAKQNKSINIVILVISENEKIEQSVRQQGTVMKKDDLG